MGGPKFDLNKAAACMQWKTYFFLNSNGEEKFHKTVICMKSFNFVSLF